MDWKYKHFNQTAIFNASRQDVLEAARAVLAESFGAIEDTADGLIARGRIGWQAAIGALRVTPASNGTQVSVELLVERVAIWGYMLFDIGDYYNGRIDQWFSGIAAHLSGTQEQALVSTTASSWRLRQGCLRGCLVYLFVGACLASFAIPLDHALFLQLSGSSLGPFSVMASVVGLLVGVLTFVYIAYPHAPVSKIIRTRLRRT
jgi:hypothetical protein